MSMVNITGPRDDIDKMAYRYLSHYDIHLVNALKELSGIETLKAYTSSNQYQPWDERIDDLLALVDEPIEEDNQVESNLSFEEVKDIVTSVERDVSDKKNELQELTRQLNTAKFSHEEYEPFSDISYSLEKILSIKHLKFRFGRFTTKNYQIFEKYIDSMVPSVFIPSKVTDGYVYGVYFTTPEARQRVDALYYSLAWERIYVTEEKGTFKDIVNKYSEQIDKLTSEKEKVQSEIFNILHPNIKKLKQAKNTLKELSKAHKIRQYAAITRDEFAQKETRYLVLGWMAEEDAVKLEKELAQVEEIEMYIEDDKDVHNFESPTKLRNNFFARPFEMITKMYGVPNYRELDPTSIVAVTYSLFFGAMFGDLGQGFLLFLAGLFGYFNEKLSLAKMFVPVGISSMIFGLIYGSLFGLEDVIPALWGNPMNQLSTIPFFGSLNTVFIVAVGSGMFVILLTMVLNIYLRLKNGEKWQAILNKNGIAGFAFYGLIVLLLVLYMMGQEIPAMSLFIAIIVGLLLVIAFEEPLTRLIEHKKAENEDGIVMQLLTIFFETFETVLTYFSNTISFVRIGAFAIAHVAMMGVVLMFANIESANPNWFVLVLGNLFVTGFEGLVIFIQVLRLEFYEIFSHFYSGNGIEFESIWDKK